ncbi:hypothetical protein KAT42_03070, partial [Candidatus Bathyarchaeota archaeon]|nr:hypothetical protein [Candidatus Bathyarchaeota archaeon]
DTFCGGFANRIDQPISYQHRGWRNQSYWYEDGTYPYEYSPAQAAAAFDSAGFVEGSDANPYYDAGFPGSAPNLRIHPDTGVTMNPLEVCVRSDNSRFLSAGRALCDALRAVGVPVNQIEADSSVLYPKVMNNFEYHVYAGGAWGGGRYPGPTAYALFHHDNYVLGGANYVTGVDQNGDPNYAKLSELLDTARYPRNHSEAVSATKKAMGYLIERCITISLYGPKYFYAWSTNLLGVVPQPYPFSPYTFMNAYKVDGSPIRIGHEPPSAMNKIYSWFTDYLCLDRMDLYSGLDNPPYDNSIVQAGYIHSWSTDTWTDSDDLVNKTVVTQTYRDDAWFVEPVTGNQLEHVNITHHYASIWYEYQLTDALNNDQVWSIKTVRIAGPHSLEIYWNTPGYWNTLIGSTSIKSFNWFAKGSLSQRVTETLSADNITGYISCTEPVFWVLNAKSGGTPLVLGTDYDIYKDPDGPHNADVRIINPAYLGASIDITYMATDNALGYYPGGLTWQDAFEGAGMYYATDFAPGAGGYLTLKRNPFYPLETPPLGEVDFIKKPSGCYKIDIFDIVLAASAYGTQGVGEPDSKWLAGVDLAYPGGQIDIFDVVTIASKYGAEWDCP